MNSYEIWVDLAPGTNDLEFVSAVQGYLGHFQAAGKLHSFRIRRRKFGFGPEALGEFCLSLEFVNLSLLDEAFSEAATRSGEIERLHSEVFSRVVRFKSALYRDFPDPERMA